MNRTSRKIIHVFRGRNEEGDQSAEPIPAELSGTADNEPAHKLRISELDILAHLFTVKVSVRFNF